MGKNFNQVTFKSTDPAATFTVPAGVTNVHVVATPAVYGRDLGPGLSTSRFIIDKFGTAWVWGYNTAGALGMGDGTTQAFSTPVAIRALALNAWRQISISYDGAASLGIDQQGQLWGWGSNSAGGIGDGTTVAKSSPVQVVGPANSISFSRIVSGDTSAQTSMAIDQNGALWSWGLNQNGLLGQGLSPLSTAAISSPVQVVGSHVFKSARVATNFYAMGIDSAGQAWAWGVNTTGNLGNGTFTGVSSPVAVLGSHVFKKVVITPGLNSYGLDTSGALWAWGSQGAIGNGQLSTAYSSPVAVAGSHVFQSVESNGNTVVAIDTSGQAWTWGLNTAGALGTSNSTGTFNASTPLAVVGGVVFSQVWTPPFASSSPTIYGLDVNGNLWAWGSNTNGALGANINPGTTAAVSAPVQVSGGRKWAFFLPTMEAAFSSNLAAPMAVDVNGQVWTWGVNSFGEAGIGTSTGTVSSPVQVLGPAKMWNIPLPTTTSVNVTPGTVLSVSFGANACLGATPVGNMPQSITIEYYT